MTRESRRQIALWALGVLVACQLVAAPVALAQSELSGRVVAEDGSPIRDATIRLSSVGYAVRSDSLGNFKLSGQPGASLSLALSAVGYREETASVTLNRRGGLTKDFVLKRTDAPLPEMNPSDRVLTGRITDTDRAPIAYANIQVNGGRAFVSDDSGRFSVPIDFVGGLQLLVRRIGFAPVEVKLASMPDTVVGIQMTPLATALPEQRIAGRTPFVSLDVGGFYRRMADRQKGIGSGWFITPEELEVRNPFIVTSAVEHLPNIRIRPFDGRLPLNRNLRIEDAMGCPMTIYLGHVRISPWVRSGKLINEEINTLITPTSLSGVEVHARSSTVPFEFSMVEGTCGVVVFWSK
jgi:hypothetical protein